MPRQLVLNAFLMSTGHHEASWRMPGVDPFANRDVGHFQALARVAERGRMDSVFFADSPSLMTDPARRPAEALDPVVLLAAMAAVTERIGLVATASTTYQAPYNLARAFASLDLVSHGRAGWNMVTSAAADAAANFGHAEIPSHADRYRRGAEFLEVVLGLWRGWEPGAVVGDKAAGIHTDPRLLHALDHEGEHFTVRGPLNVGRSEQGHPVVVQAGSSGPGIELAAAYADAVFTAQTTVEDGRAFRAELRAATRAAGRNPDHIKVLPGIVPMIGSTEAEARELERDLGDLMVHRHALAQLATDIGIPAEEIDLDAPLPDDIRPAVDIQGNRSRYELTVGLARREALTVRQLLTRLGGGRGHRTFTGTPEQLADDLEEWFATGAADGFNVMAPVLPSGLETFVDHVVPILVERGLYRSEYDGSTLREHYGLPVPSVATSPGRGRQTA